MDIYTAGLLIMMLIAAAVMCAAIIARYWDV